MVRPPRLTRRTSLSSVTPYPCWRWCLAVGLLLVCQGQAQAGRLLVEEAAHYRDLGHGYQAHGQIDEAIAEYNKAALSYPEYADVHNDLGIMYEARGDLARAETEYLRTVQINPRHAGAHMNLALLYEAQGKIDQAAPHWQERVRIGPLSDPWVKRARESLIQHKLKVPELQEAVDAKRLGEVTLAYEEGMFRLDHREWAQAQEAFEQVLTWDPNHRDALAGLAVAKQHLALHPSPVSLTPPESQPPTNHPHVNWTPKGPTSVPVQPSPQAPAPAPKTNWTARSSSSTDMAGRAAPRPAIADQAKQLADEQVRDAKRRQAMQQAMQQAEALSARAPVAAVPHPAAKPKLSVPPAAPVAPAVMPAWKPVEAMLAAPVISAPKREVPIASKPAVATTTVTPISTPREARALAEQLAREKTRTRDLMTRELFQRGLILYRQKQYAQAVEQFQRALTIDPNHRDSQQYLREAQTALARGEK